MNLPARMRTTGPFRVSDGRTCLGRSSVTSRRDTNSEQLLEQWTPLDWLSDRSPASSIPSRQITLQAFNNAERLASTQRGVPYALAAEENSMIIYGSSVSPYVPKSWPLRREKGLEFKVKGVT